MSPNALGLFNQSPIAYSASKQSAGPTSVCPGSYTVAPTHGSARYPSIEKSGTHRRRMNTSQEALRVQYAATAASERHALSADQDA